MSAFTLSTTQKKKPLILCNGRVHTDRANTTLLFGNAVSAEIRIFEEKICDRDAI